MKKKSWKADEMEMSINFKAMRMAYVFGVLALGVFCGYEFIRFGELPFFPFLILVVQGWLFFAVKLFLTRKMTQMGDGDEK